MGQKICLFQRIFICSPNHKGVPLGWELRIVGLVTDQLDFVPWAAADFHKKSTEQERGNNQTHTPPRQKYKNMYNNYSSLTIKE